MNRTRIQAALGALVVLYFFGASIATMYFAFDFAKHHGVVAWFTVGGIVATAKGLFWPFFLWAGAGAEALARQVFRVAFDISVFSVAALALWSLARWGGAHKHRGKRRVIGVAVAMLAGYAILSMGSFATQHSAFGIIGVLIYAVGLLALWAGWRHGVTERSARLSGMTVQDVRTGVVEPLVRR